MRRMYRNILLILLSVCLATSGAQAQTVSKEIALELLNQGKYKSAIDAFNALEGDEESRYYMLYASARDFERDGYFEQASALYGMLPGFLDSDMRLTALVVDERMYAYQQAAKLEAEGDLQGAGEAFDALVDYMDSKERAEGLLGTGLPSDPAEIYALAEQCELDGDHLAAFHHFSSIPDHQDAQVRAFRAQIRWQELTYWDAEQAEAAGESQMAMELFASLEDYRDSRSRAKKLTPDEGKDTANAPMLYPYYDNASGKVGYINVVGETVLEPQWQDGGSFYDGFAWICDSQTGMYSYINLDGEPALDLMSMEVSDFCEGTARIFIHNAYAVINTDGDIVCSGLDSVSDEVSEGMRVIEQGGLFGYAGTQGRVIEPQWPEVWHFYDGMAAVRSPETGKYKGYINLNGELVIPYESLDGNRFQSGLTYTMFASTGSLGGQRGFIDKTGAMVMPEIPRDGIGCNGFNDGLAMCYNDGYFFIDRDGNVAIPGPFKYAREFKNGHAVVTHYNMETYLIDTQGTAISDAYTNISDFTGGLTRVEKNGLYGFIDEQGVPVIPAMYLGAEPFHGELAKIDDGDTTMYINRNNEVVCSWDKPDLTPADGDEAYARYLEE